MSASCCDQAVDPHRGDERYRRVLWAVLAINVAMFAVEVAAGLAAGSASLQADALDFLGDAGNYAISLFVVGMALRYRAMAAFAKGATMGLFGLWVLAVTAWHAWHGTLPHAFTMGAVRTSRRWSPTPLRSVSYGLTRSGRRQHAFGVDLHAQRRARESCGASRRPWCVWHGHRLARRGRTCNNGRTCLAGRRGCSPSVTVRAANFEFASVVTLAVM